MSPSTVLKDHLIIISYTPFSSLTTPLYTNITPIAERATHYQLHFHYRAAAAAASLMPEESSKQKDVIHMERNRREKMAEFYTTLQSIVPNLFPKATRTRIIDETIAYIKRLEEAIAALREQGAAPQPQTQSQSASATVEVTCAAGATAFFGIRFASGARPGAVTRVLQVFEAHRAEVLCATVTREEGDAVTAVTVTALVAGEEALDKIKADLMII